jgi:hypothetical protein
MATAISAEAVSNGQSLAAAHRELLADQALQFHFAKIAPPPPVPEWLKWLAKVLQALGPVMNYVFWGGIVLLAALILYFIGREILRRLPSSGDATEKATAATAAEFRPSKERAQALLEEADRLAREGRFSEAVRVLLHRSINDIEDTFPTLIMPSLTAREIGRLEQLSLRGREVFGRIARAVETSLFGGRAVDAGEFAECRRVYADFVFGAAPP